MSLGRILVVDDDEDIRAAVRLTLTKAGYEVLLAKDGAEAIKYIESNDNPFNVSLIICDILMPKVNGVEAIAYIRQEFPSVPIVVLTGEPQLSGAIHLFKLGIIDYLSKPISPEKLIQVVQKSVRDHVYKGPY